MKRPYIQPNSIPYMRMDKIEERGAFCPLEIENKIFRTYLIERPLDQVLLKCCKLQIPHWMGN